MKPHLMSRQFQALTLAAALLGPAAQQATAQRNARELSSDGIQMPTWSVDPEFLQDTFCFTRIRYSVDGFYGYGHDRSMRWATDAPDSDINFGFRLQQMTSMAVHPDGVFLQLTDPRLYNHPFIYIVEPGRIHFSDEEMNALRAYLLNGGFLMFDDFWGVRELRNLVSELKRLFPDRDPQELQLDHPIFSCVFPLKKKPQVPNVDVGIASEYTQITWERPDAKEPSYQAIYDDKGRMMIILCHNTDNGDGWEREGENAYYFREFSEKQAYPMGINILFYAMTH